MERSQFISRLELAHHPEIFIPENVASLPDWNSHKAKDEFEMRLNQWLYNSSRASLKEMINCRCYS